MLSLQEFNTLSNVAKSNYLRDNFPVNAKSRSGRKILVGIGVNDADYLVNPTIEGKRVRCPAYDCWSSMLTRSYSQKWSAKHSSYVGILVYKEWHSFSLFREWWMANQVDGWQLDKDLLSDNRVYSPDNCIFLPQWLNKLTINSGAARGNCPIGVHWREDYGKYQAQCSNPFGKNQHLGYFSIADDAHNAWKARKLEIAAELKPRMDEIDCRIYARVVEIISRAK